MKSQRGFTLVELAVVLGVIGVLSAIATPNLLTMRDNFRVKGATTDISSMLRLGRSAAMQENKPFALLVRTGSTTIATDDRAVLVRCPTGTTLVTAALTGITTAMLDGTAAMPVGFTIVRKAELGAASVGIQPGSAGILPITQRPYNNISRTAGCSFCASGNGTVFFTSDGTVSMTGTPNSGSITVSHFKGWPTPMATQMYTITLFPITGEVRVWH